MSNLATRLAALEKATGAGKHESTGTIEHHMPGGSKDPSATPCDLRKDLDHGPECVFKVALRTNDGVRLMRIYGFDLANLD
jgi:hypothetical protein